MQKMSDIEKILSMGIGRSGLGFEEESRVVAETIKELQAYRATGLTPTMVKDLIKSCREHEKNAMENAHIVDAYNAIGTVDQCREAVERMKPKEFIQTERFNTPIWQCPICFSELYSGQKYCDECGNLIGWEGLE